ncbi:PepSY domain-containing protein [Amphritea sp. 1_MG-2023]|uniref:PepSY domain-containing protein n=1 Tax=Amphritea sp. 1_MG-2023 TaxID=3062670 RepID=UPI0026E321E3|nr:PepSY domain-containing protein [Amphritea sp. 1_MG-2023]MDO6565301.1 PepSY domain-containing protein [Amphritea sp. 1_MG-2023]
MFRGLSYVFLVLLLTATQGTVAAAGEEKIGFAAMTMMTANSVSLQQAAKAAKQNHGGKVVKAETQKRGKRLVHHIRLINHGRVKTVLVDADTGREISP